MLLIRRHGRTVWGKGGTQVGRLVMKSSDSPHRRQRNSCLYRLDRRNQIIAVSRYIHSSISLWLREQEKLTMLERDQSRIFLKQPTTDPVLCFPLLQWISKGWLLGSKISLRTFFKSAVQTVSAARGLSGDRNRNRRLCTSIMIQDAYISWRLTVKCTPKKINGSTEQ